MTFTILRKVQLQKGLVGDFLLEIKGLDGAYALVDLLFINKRLYSTMKQISFYITCMNRLKHLQETLEKNILNFLKIEVEFVVLDYNSQDGLEEWIAQSMMKNILRWVFLSIIGLLNQLIIDAAIAGIWF